MPSYADVNGDPISEEKALGLQEGQKFAITWDDGVTVECIKERDDSWSVGHRYGGALHFYGRVQREGAMFRASSLPQYKAQQTFSAAARKYV